MYDISNKFNNEFKPSFWAIVIIQKVVKINENVTEQLIKGKTKW